MKTQKPKKTRASAQTLVSKAKPTNRKLPPDPDGLFKRAAARGKQVIAMYEKLNPGAEGFLVSNIVRDLICLSDRDPKLGNVDKECVFAVQSYQEFVAENMWAVGWYDDMEAAREAAEQKMFSDVK